MVNVFALPQAGFTLSEDTLFWPENSVEIETLFDNENCLYTLGNGMELGDCNATIAYNGPGEYEITQMVTNTDLCEANNSELLVILPSIFVPNIITPNNDGDDSGVFSNGLNEGWYLKGIEYLDKVGVSIFDRWGGLVYENASYSNDNPFKGYNLNGDKLKDGVYFYVIESSRIEQLTGSLTILRTR